MPRPSRSVRQYGANAIRAELERVREELLSRGIGHDQQARMVDTYWAEENGETILRGIAAEEAERRANLDRLIGREEDAHRRLHRILEGPEATCGAPKKKCSSRDVDLQTHAKLIRRLAQRRPVRVRPWRLPSHAQLDPSEPWFDKRSVLAVLLELGLSQKQTAILLFSRFLDRSEGAGRWTLEKKFRAVYASIRRLVVDHKIPRRRSV